MGLGRALNEEQRWGARCFGCGLENPEGLGLRVYRDPESYSRLLGTVTPRPSTAGLPRAVHVGLLHAALDCMAAWGVRELRQGRGQVPMAKRARVRYARSAPVEAAYELEARVLRDPPTPREPFVMYAAIRDAEGELVAEAELEYVLVPLQRARTLLGVDELSDFELHPHERDDA